MMTGERVRMAQNEPDRPPPNPSREQCRLPDVRVSVVPDPHEIAVTIQFSERISWLNLSPDRALSLADDLRRCAESLQGEGGLADESDESA